MHAHRETKHCNFRDIYLESGGESFDLHNCFHFAGFSYELSTRTLSLRWLPNSYAPPVQHRELYIELARVFHLSASPRDPAMPFTEDICLHSAGFLPPEAPTMQSGASDAPPNWHYVFTFTSGFILRVGAETLLCRIEPVPK